MFRIRWMILGTTMFLLAACSRLHPSAADRGQAQQLEGLWIVTSVQRDGKPDRLQVGAKMTFTDTEVSFEPTGVAEVPDGPVVVS